jgi:hypothetical protein
MPVLRINNVRTVNQRGENATLFHPFFDALALTMDVYASSDLLALPGAQWYAAYQLLDPRTETVAAQQTSSGTFQWGQWFWISKGNNWGPSPVYTTPEKWGLNWGGLGIFGFRGIIKAYSSPGGGSGLKSEDAFSVSVIRWIRIAEVFKL